MFEIIKENEDLFKIRVKISDTMTIEAICNKKDLKQLYSDMGIILSRKMIPSDEE